MYLRFLNNNDYLDLMTQKAFEQMTRDRADELCIGAEKSAEASIRDYLSEHYEIDKELNKGKLIAGYSPKINITYPAGVHIYIDGQIYKTLQTIMGVKKPCNSDYWEVMSHSEIKEWNKPERYSQMETYSVGAVVFVDDVFYKAKLANGIGIGEVRVPNVEGWKIVEAEEFTNENIKVGQPVKYNGVYYMLTKETESELNPEENTDWAVIDYYDEENYYEIGDFALYASHENGIVVVKAISNVNRDDAKIGENVTLSDPRNFSLREHMLKIAVYQLTKQLAPNNVSVARIKDYEETMVWLNKASKLQIAPNIERKHNEAGEETTEWAVSKFESNLGRRKYGWGSW